MQDFRDKILQTAFLGGIYFHREALSRLSGGAEKKKQQRGVDDL